jgi:Tol biopolymer transport system component
MLNLPWLSRLSLLLVLVAAGCTPEGSGGGSKADGSTGDGSTSDPDAPDTASDEDGSTSGCEANDQVLVITQRGPGAATALAVLVNGGESTALDLPMGAEGVRDVVVSPDGAKVVWSSRAPLSGGAEAASWNLWVANIDGSSPKPLTSADVADLNSVKPVFGPDSDTLYFVSNAKLDGSFSAKVNAYNVWKLTLSGSVSPTALTLNTSTGHDVSTDGTPLAVSGDGQFVAFASKMDLDAAFNRKAQGSHNLFVMLADGTNIKALTRNEFEGLDSGDLFIPSGGPAADTLLFLSRTSLSNEWNAIPAGPNLWQMNLDGGRRKSLTKDTSLPISDLKVAPRGGYAAFTAYKNLDNDPAGDPAGRNLWLYDLAAGTQRPVTRQELPYTQDTLYTIEVSGLTFSSSGDQFLFSANSHLDGTPHVYLLPPDAPADDPLVLAYQAHCEHPDHQGDKTCEENWQPTQNLWLLNPADLGAAPQHITDQRDLPDLSFSMPAAGWITSCK